VLLGVVIDAAWNSVGGYDADDDGVEQEDYKTGAPQQTGIVKLGLKALDLRRNSYVCRDQESHIAVHDDGHDACFAHVCLSDDDVDGLDDVAKSLAGIQEQPDFLEYLLPHLQCTGYRDLYGKGELA